MGIGSQYLPLHDDGSSNSGISSAGTSRSSTPSSFIYGSPRRHYYFRVARIKWIVYWSICGILLFLMVSLFIWPQQWKVFWGNRASSSSIPYDNIDVGMSSGQEDEEEQQELPIEINNSTQQVPDFSIYDSWKPVSITNASFHSQYERYLQCPYLDGQDTCALTKRISINGYEWQGQGELSTIRQQNLLETARKCLKGVRVGFSGDSLTRQQYHSWACMLYNTGVEIVKEKENDVLTAHKVNELEHAFYWTGNQLNPYFVKSNRARGEKAKFYFEELDPDMVTLMDANPDYLVLNTGRKSSTIIFSFSNNSSNRLTFNIIPSQTGATVHHMAQIGSTPIPKSSHPLSPTSKRISPTEQLLKNHI